MKEIIKITVHGNKFHKTNIKTDHHSEGELIEQMVRRITENKEPIENEVPVIYTARNEGVRPEYDIRSDKWEIVQDAMNKVTGAKLEERKKALDELKKKTTTEQNEQNQQTPME